MPREGLAAHSKGGAAGTTRTVGTPAGCHCPLYSLHYTFLHCATTRLPSTLHHLMVGHHHSAPHYTTLVAPGRATALHLQSVQLTTSVSHLYGTANVRRLIRFMPLWRTNYVEFRLASNLWRSVPYIPICFRVSYQCTTANMQKCKAGVWKCVRRSETVGQTLACPPTQSPHITNHLTWTGFHNSWRIFPILTSPPVLDP